MKAHRLPDSAEPHLCPWAHAARQLHTTRSIGYRCTPVEDVAPHACQISEVITTITPGDRGIEDRHRVIEEIRRGALKSADFIDQLASPKAAADAYAGLQSRKHFSVVFDWSKLKA